ncbi:MAG: rod shape-determining protein RodA [Cystobacterineae bacterium]|nr:rod shape-determining protein RodA [Cystobacterineae bacterium]
MKVRIEKRMFANWPWSLIGSMLLIAVIGLWNMASASRASHAPLAGAQATFLVVSLVAAIIVALLDYRWVRRMVVPVYFLNLAALVALRFFGHQAKGATSWFLIGPWSVQPAEFMKLSLVMMLAKLFHDDFKPESPTYGFRRLLIPTIVTLVPAVLILKEPDLGTTLMMLLTAMSMMVFAKLRWTVVLTLCLAGIAVVGVLWNDYVREQSEPRWTLVRRGLKPHQDVRVSGWLSPETDLRGANYHQHQSRIAVGSGGLTGKGWQRGSQSGLRYLPEQHSDFIFSVWAEEQGFVACLALIILYGIVFVSILLVAYGSRDRFGAFVAVGFSAMLFWQIFENIGMGTGLLPVTGITLPLFSYGGSSMLSTMLAMGLLMNISINRRR